MTWPGAQRVGRCRVPDSSPHSLTHFRVPPDSDRLAAAPAPLGVAPEPDLTFERTDYLVDHAGKDIMHVSSREPRFPFFAPAEQRVKRAGEVGNNLAPSPGGAAVGRPSAIVDAHGACNRQERLPSDPTAEGTGIFRFEEHPKPSISMVADVAVEGASSRSVRWEVLQRRPWIGAAQVRAIVAEEDP